MKNNTKSKFNKNYRWFAILIPIAITLVANQIRKFNNTDNCNLLNQNNKASPFYPICDCGNKMTIFDGCWWYTCPECGNKKKIIGTKEYRYDEIFKPGHKEANSDFELADLCRGGDLSEQ